MTALVLVQNEGVMLSPSDVVVIGRQVMAASQQNTAYESYTKPSGFQSSVESNRATIFVSVLALHTASLRLAE